MRRLLALCLLLPALPGFAQQPKLKLDALGLPAFPGAANVGHISLPLAAILKPEPGQKLTGPALTDLAIQTYRTPLSVPVTRLASYYLKYAAAAGWRILDDIQDGPSNRSLVFWSPDAPGYLTVEFGGGPNETHQIDLTRLLGDVDPSRPGEVLKLTGKRVRFQRAEVTFAGRFLNMKTNKLERRVVRAIEGRAETGLAFTDAQWVTPIGETYAVAIRITDPLKQMSAVDVYAENDALLTHAESPRAVRVFNLVAKVRATQGLSLRVSISGPDPAVPLVPVRAAPAAIRASATPPSGPTPLLKTPVPPAPHPAPPAKGSAPKHRIPLPTGDATAGAATPAPPRPVARPITTLTEWDALRPPLCALPEARRGVSSSKTEQIVLVKDQDAGPSCDQAISRSIPWHGETTESFDFSPDLFHAGFLRAATGPQRGSLTVRFLKGSGKVNTYTEIQTKTTSTTNVLAGYTYQQQWIILPSKKPNPQELAYTAVTLGQPGLTQKSSGDCPPPAPIAPPTSAHTAIPSPTAPGAPVTVPAPPASSLPPIPKAVTGH